MQAIRMVHGPAFYLFVVHIFTRDLDCPIAWSHSRFSFSVLRYYNAEHVVRQWHARYIIDCIPVCCLYDGMVSFDPPGRAILVAV